MAELHRFTDDQEPQVEALTPVRTQIAGLVRELFDRESKALEAVKTGDPAHEVDRLADRYHRDFRTLYLSYSEIIRHWTLQELRHD